MAKKTLRAKSAHKAHKSDKHRHDEHHATELHHALHAGMKKDNTVKKFAIKFGGTLLVLFLLNILYHGYFRKTALYYRLFRMSEVFFDSLPVNFLSSLLYFVIFLAISAILLAVANKIIKLSIRKQTKRETMFFGGVTAVFLFSNVLFRAWLNGNYEFAIRHVALMQSLNYGIIFIFVVFLSMTIFGYTFRKH